MRQWMQTKTNSIAKGEIKTALKEIKKNEMI